MAYALDTVHMVEYTQDVSHMEGWQGVSDISKRQCSVEGCEGPILVVGKRLCSKHYWRQHRYGDVNATKRPTVGMSPEDRFWLKVDRSGGDDACWPWTATRNSDGYGRFRRVTGENMEGAHRCAYQFTYGEITPGAHICHHCDNPPCCNPSHLYEGDATTNSHDKESRGRANHARGQASGAYTHPESVPRGERNPNAKLTESQVIDIRRAHASGEASYRELARQHGVTVGMIGHIVRGIAWKHLGG